MGGLSEERFSGSGSSVEDESEVYGEWRKLVQSSMKRDQ